MGCSLPCHVLGVAHGEIDWWGLNLCRLNTQGANFLQFLKDFELGPSHPHRRKDNSFPLGVVIWNQLLEVQAIDL
jgi:hypothetical protein